MVLSKKQIAAALWCASMVFQGAIDVPGSPVAAPWAVRALQIKRVLTKTQVNASEDGHDVDASSLTSPSPAPTPSLDSLPHELLKQVALLWRNEWATAAQALRQVRNWNPDEVSMLREAEQEALEAAEAEIERIRAEEEADVSQPVWWSFLPGKPDFFDALDPHERKDFADKLNGKRAEATDSDISKRLEELTTRSDWVLEIESRFPALRDITSDLWYDLDRRSDILTDHCKLLETERWFELAKLELARLRNC